MFQSTTAVLRCARRIAAASDPELDQAVRAVLAELADALHAERAQVITLNVEAGMLDVTHEFCVEGVQPVQDLTYRIEHEWEGLLQHGEVVGLRQADVPAHATALSQTLCEEGVQSFCLFPIRAKSGDAPVGFLCVEWLREAAEEDLDLELPREVATLLGDMWRRKADNAQREALEVELRKAQKREATTALASGLAHDFNNILMVVAGATDLAQQHLRDVPAPRQVGELLGQVCEAVERSKRLTSQLLGLARASVTRRSSVRAPHYIEGTVRTLACTVPANIAWQLDIDKEGPAIWTSPSELEQIVLNLCLNASHAMPRGGVLRVEYGLAEGRAGDEPRALLTVRDSGCGMTPAEREKAFDPFFTTRAASGGTGLGLPVVRSIVEACSGQIEVHSVSGEGTRVSVWFPVAAHLAESRPAEVSMHAVGGHETILLAEDDPFVRKLSSQILGRAGYRVVTADDGGGALAALRRHAGFDAMVLDVMMPCVEGTEVARQARALRAELPVVFTTGYAARGQFEAIAGWRHAEVLQKPFVSRSLLQAVRRVLA